MSRDRIINSAIKEFSEKGFYRASIDDIAKRANVAKGTVYYNFKNKSYLFKVLLTEGIEFMIKEIKKSLNQNTSTQKQIENIIKKQIDIYIEFNEFSKLFFNEISNGLDDDIIEEVNVLKEKYIMFIANQFEEGYKFKIIKKTNFKILAIGLIGYIDAICSSYLKNPNVYNKNELIESVMLLLNDTIMVA